MSIMSSPRISFLFSMLLLLKGGECFTIQNSHHRHHHRHQYRNEHQTIQQRTKAAYMSTSVEENVSRFRPIGTRTRTRATPDQQMKFIGTKRVMTEPIEIVTPTDSSDSSDSSDSKSKTIQLLNEFFLDDSNRNLLFPSNNAQTLNMNEVMNDQKIMDTWMTEARLGGGEGPTTNLDVNGNGNGNANTSTGTTIKQAVFKIDALLQMPGLKIISESTIGMKLILDIDNNNDNESSLSSSSSSFYPEYQFTLLESNLKPNGPRPIVWLFNKLTKYRDSTSSFTKVRVEEVQNVQDSSNSNSNSNNNKQPKIAFVTDARLETNMHLPSRLLRVLPNVNISKFETQGSEAVQKLLEKELEPALNGFCNAFCNFMKEKKDEEEGRSKVGGRRLAVKEMALKP